MSPTLTSFSLTKRISAAAAIALLVLAGSAMADADSARGQALYDNHCGACHDDKIHKRENRRVNSMHELRIWVSAMSVHAGLNWRYDDIEDVALYLSRRLYRFEE